MSVHVLFTHPEHGETRVYRDDSGDLFIGDISAPDDLDWTFSVVMWCDVPAFIAEIQRVYAEGSA